MRELFTWKSPIILLIFCLFSFFSIAQRTQSGKVSCPEKRWAFFHAFIARQSYKISKQTLHISDSIRNTQTLDGDINGGQVDAFKHAYWMASLSQHIKGRKAVKLGKAHEKGNYKSFKKRKKKGIQTSHDKVSSEMDLWNNQQGLKIGLVYKDQDLMVIQQAIIDSIHSGVMKIIRKNSSGQFLDCEGNIIPKESLIGNWENEKCLVPSNFYLLKKKY